MLHRLLRFGPPCAVATALLLGAVASAAAAREPGAEAERLIRHGVELRRGHDDEGAAREFEKAYDLVHSPRSAGQLGLAEQALGRWEDAERHVSEAIHAADDGWVVKNRAALDEALGTIQAHLGRVQVIGDPEGAEVSLNGKPVGRLPLGEGARVSAGQVDVEVHAAGYLAAQRTLTIVGGQYQRVVIHLAKEVAPPAPDAKPAAAPVAAARPGTTPVPPEGGPPPTRAILAWSAAGLAGAGLAAGIVWTVLHGQHVSSFDQGCALRRGAPVDKTTGLASGACQDAYNTYQSDRTIAIVGYAAAGAFAATWLVLQLSGPSAAGEQPAEHAARAPLCVPALTGVGVSCAIRF